MAKNKVEDLKNHLFAQLERLNDESISPEDMKAEIEKAKAMEGISKQVIDIERINIEKKRLVINAYESGIISQSPKIDTFLQIEEQKQ